MDDVDTPFLKPPDYDNNNYDGILTALTDTGVRILRIRCNPSSVPQDDNDADAAVVDK